MLASIDSLVELTLSVAPAVPGISLAIVQGGDTVAIKGYGMANVEHRVPVTDKTVFNIASATKPFTAAAVMKLVEEGRLRLDDSVGGVLPQYDGPGKSATVQQLLNHTSGIPTYFRKMGVAEGHWEIAGERLPLSRRQMLAVMAEERALDFEPGTGYAYNNSGFYLLGMLLETLGRETYEEHLSRTQFQPLGLAATRLCSAREIIPDRAQGYEVHRGRLVNAPPPSVNDIGSDGGLCSTPRDLVRWLRAFAKGEIVGRSTVERMTASTIVGGRDHWYGYGLRLSPTGFGHTGGTPFFSTVMVHYPDDDLTIAMIANGGIHLVPLMLRIAHQVRRVPEAS